MPPHAEAAVTGGAESICRVFVDVGICREALPCCMAAATALLSGSRAVICRAATFCAAEMEICTRRAIVAEVAAAENIAGAARRSVCAPSTWTGIGTAASSREICDGPDCEAGNRFSKGEEAPPYKTASGPDWDCSE